MATRVVFIHPLGNAIYFIWTPGALSVKLYIYRHQSPAYEETQHYPHTATHKCHADEG